MSRYRNIYSNANKHNNKIEKLIVIDKDNRCVGLITVTDLKKSATIRSYKLLEVS